MGQQLRVLRPARAPKATAAYLELPATSQAPDPKAKATSQARIYPEGHPGLARRGSRFPGPRRVLRIPTKAPDESFEPYRDQVRRDGVNPFTSGPKEPWPEG